MRRLAILFLMACTRAPAPPQSSSIRVAPEPRREIVRATPLAGPRVAEVLTAAGEVRDALPLGQWVWLATAGGLVRASLDLTEEARFSTLDGLPANDLWSLAASGDHLFAATPAGVISTRLDEGRPVEIRLLPLAQARALAIVDGTLHAGSWSRGVVKWDGARFVPLVEGVQVNRLIAEGHTLFIAAASGLGRCESGKTVWFGKKEGLPDSFVWDFSGGVAETIGGPARLDGDHFVPQPDPPRRRAPIAFGDGRLILDEDGVTRLGPDGAERATLKPLGLPSADVTALAVGDDALYVGTFDHGVAAVRWNRDEGTLAIEPIAGLIDARVNALAVRRDAAGEELWVGTARGASRVRGGQVTHFTEADGLADDHVNALNVDGETVRIVTTKGYAELGPTGIRRITPEVGLPTTRLFAIARAADGALWLGGAHGAARLGCERAGCDSPSWSLARAISGELPDDYVTAFANAGDDLWIGTYASGLARRRGHRFTILREPELPSNWINAGALAFWRERIWAGTVERGLSVSPRQRPGEDEGRWSSLTIADGLPSDDVTALAADEDGLWVGTRGGVARVVMPVLVGRGE